MKQTVLITGASRGIGAATAVLFAERGWQVVLNYQHSAARALALEQQCRAKGGSVWACPADVRSREQVTALVRAAEERWGQVDVLVNNAGTAQQKLFTETTEKDWDDLFDVHMKGTFHCCQEVLPGMIRRQQGKIINISSIWGLTGASCEVAYSAAKGAVIAFTKALAKEVGPSHIQVNCVAPGVIETEMNAALDQETRAALQEEAPLGLLGRPEDIAKTIYFLASEEADFITGQILSPNGGLVI